MNVFPALSSFPKFQNKSDAGPKTKAQSKVFTLDIQCTGSSGNLGLFSLHHLQLILGSSFPLLGIYLLWATMVEEIILNALETR